MFKTVTPEQAGISSAYVEKFIRTLEKRGLVTHSVLLMRGDDIFGEYYWKPFDEAFCHRLYSETKSYVSVAIGLLEQDGKLNLDDPICKYFPEKLEREPNDYLKKQTIRQMLTMSTCGETPSWFRHSDPDRVHLYLNENNMRIPAGMRYSYDSPGSQVLCSLAEKLAGKPLFDFLNERIFSKLGTFKTATILKTKTEDSFGDSAMVCTARDMASFARFVMNYGKWNGEQILNEDYLRKATSPAVDNDFRGFDYYAARGYGYQFWCLGDEGFFFNGMGCQLTLCLPKQDLIFSITSDNQGFDSAKDRIVTAFFDLIVENLQDTALPEDPAAYEKCLALGKTLELAHLAGNRGSGYGKTLEGKTYICEENPTGITKFSFRFTGEDTGELHYTNAQGDKILPFGIGKNVFCKFPQFGYSDEHAGLPGPDGFLYDCAVSAAWREEQKILLKVQIVDRYFGNMLAIFSFREDYAVIRMTKTAEDFLGEYEGMFNAWLEA